jgi:zinc transport system substrate-binding protein
MRSRKYSLIFFSVLIAVSAFAGGSSQRGENTVDESAGSGINQNGVSAFVSILPQASFVERIGGGHVRVEVLVEPGSNPHIFESTPRQMVTLGEADVYFGIGFPFEERILKKVSDTNPDLAFVETDEGISRRALDTPLSHDHEMERHEHDTNAHRHESDSGILDPHIWLSYGEILVQAENIFKGLSSVDPAHENEFKTNYETFTDELEGVHARLKKLLEPYRGRSFIVFHPAFGYFADTYDLVQVPIEIEGKSPTPRQIEFLIEHARETNAEMIFVSPQFDKKSANTIAEAINGVVVSINPLEKDVLQNLEKIAEKIKTALR